MLEKLPAKFKDEIIKLFKTYNDIFAKTDTYIGIYNGSAHKIDTSNAKPFKSYAIHRSQASEVVAEEEIKKLMEAGLLIKSHSL